MGLSNKVYNYNSFVTQTKYNTNIQLLKYAYYLTEIAPLRFGYHTANRDSWNT